jgi:hypothetical protein
MENLVTNVRLQTPIEYCLSMCQDSRNDQITREEAGKLVDDYVKEVFNIPCLLSAEFVEGWLTACEVLSLALRFKEYRI